MKYKATEIIVGTVTVIALGILIGVTVNLKKSTIFSRKYPLFAYFKDVKRLEEGAPVYVHGVVRGDVREITATGQRDYPVCVKIMLTTGTVLHEGAIPRIVAAGLMGETEINIEDTSPTARQLLPGDVLYGVYVMDISDLLAEAPTLVQDLQKSIGAVSEMLQNPRHRQAVTRILESASSITARLNTLLGTSSEDIREAIRNIRRATEHLDQLLVRTDSMLTTVGENLSGFGTDLSGALGDLRSSASLLAEELTSAARRIDRTAQRADRLIAAAASLLEENREQTRRAVEGFTSASTHLGNILARIDRGEATVAEIILGPEGFDDLTGSLRGLRDSMETVSEWLEALDRWLTGTTGEEEPITIPYESTPGKPAGKNQ